MFLDPCLIVDSLKSQSPPWDFAHRECPLNVHKLDQFPSPKASLWLLLEPLHQPEVNSSRFATDSKEVGGSVNRSLAAGKRWPSSDKACVHRLPTLICGRVFLARQGRAR